MTAEFFVDACGRHAQRLAIIDGERRLTYAELLRAAAAFRDWLQSEAGVQSGDVIAACLGNSWQFAAAFFAASSLGASFALCNPQWRADENRWLASRLMPRVVLLEENGQSGWEAAGVPPLVPPAALTVCASELICHAVAENFPAAYLTTSGSTGTPRVVPRTGGNLTAGAANVARALGIGPGRRFLSVVPFHHSNGFHNCLIAPLLHGATVIMMRNFTPQACAELIQRERADVLIGSPFLFGLLADRLSDPGLLSSLDLCISAGARMPAPTAARWLQKTGKRIRQLYGSTETSVIAIDCETEDPGQGTEGVFVGRAIPGAEVRVIDGEIAVRSPAVMEGYFGESSEECFQDGFFRTGDSGYLAEGGGVYLTGRIRRVINVAGVKIDPVELERLLEMLPGVSACHADAVETAHGSSAIRVRIALAPGASISRDEVMEYCRRHLAEYKLPRIIEFGDELPVTLTGKVPTEWNKKNENNNRD